ncbi:MAG: aspartate-semialdehyde dehydrogenase [Nitrososphaerales archaeon]
MKKTGVAVFGATGAIGQQFVRFLANNPALDIRIITASRDKIGKRYSDCTSWYADMSGSGSEIPDSVANMRLSETSVAAVKEVGGVNIVFSALPSEVSKDLESQSAEAGLWVISKASSFRRDPLVPLLVPEVNPSHLKILQVQRRIKKFSSNGAIISDPNCTTTGLVLALKPILDNVGIKKVIVTSLQAMSGAGYMGLSPVSITDNVLPFIVGEETKLRDETAKIFGKFHNDEIINATFPLYSSCVRVPVDYGHMEDVYFETEKECGVDDLKRFMKRFRGEPQELGLPSAPDSPIVVREEENRPQPKLDVNTNHGMSVVVGRVREQGEGFRMMLLVHNTVRGGAGMAVLNAEYLAKKGLTKSPFKESLTA